ncbi:MAG: polysaccharide pyruvyl transferase family protein, partial [Lentisphaeria bacterium]|nr:polysaccharide pyruvyl transferase family protein [Lentisphaeria bacterium]
MVKIPIVFCFDSRIILGAAVTIKSLIEHAEETTCYDIRIFHSEISEKDQKSLQSLLDGTSHEMKFHYINPDLFKGAPRSRGSWTEIVYYRLLTPEVLTEYDKVLYSDVDVLFKSDMAELYNTDLIDYEAAAIPSYTTEYLKQTKSKRYFAENKNEKNYMSGLILFNCQKMREEKTVDRFFEVIKTFNNRLVYFDMDVFNLGCTKIKDLPLNYCVFESLYEYTDVTKISEYPAISVLYSKEDLERIKADTKIIHYAGRLGKPWQRKWVPEYYQEYINKLPAELVRYTFRDFRKCLLSKPKYPSQHFDVGFVNFFHSQNYGACLTAYALQEAVKSLGYSCAFVNEFPPKKKYNLSFGTLFVNKYLKLMPKFNNLKKAGMLADSFITGSDQVFRPQYLKRKYKRDRYLLKFVPETAKKIAFSASFGIDENEFINSKRSVVNDIKTALKTFDYLSTREDSGVDICKKQIHINAEWIIDPVFLIERQKYLELAATAKGDYRNKFVTYVLDKNPVYDELYQKLSDKYQQTPVHLAKSSLAVEEWLRAFLEAEYIVTDSFHGVCFALMFNKKFIAVVNKKRGATRFESLQKLFSLNGQFVTDFESGNIDFEMYDAERINCTIEERKKYALKVLAEQLGTKNNKFITANCTGCGACYNVCPKNAIKMVENSEGFLSPVVDKKMCVDCGLCKKTCPTVTSLKNTNSASPISYAVMASDEIRLSGASSGGVSPIFMEKFIKNGTYVVGAVYDDDWRIIHKISNQMDDLAKFKGSKYYQSNTGKVYSETKKLLDA